MKPKNFPARAMRRKLRAAQPKHGKTEPTEAQLSVARGRRTKKHGGKVARQAKWRNG
jgi:hypothetical protein